jgi:hypothetical protein
MTISISAKGFAEFVLGGPSKKATIVRNVLKPRSKETQVIILYYARAMRIIRIFHAKRNDRSYLDKELRELETKSIDARTPQARANLRNNIRAIRRYIEIYGRRNRKIVPRPRIYFSYGRVRISASPDLAIEEDGRLKLVKLGVTKKGDNPEVIRILLRVMYQAAASRFQIEPQDVVYFDILNGARIRGSRSDSDLESTINNGCDTMSGMS